MKNYYSFDKNLSLKIKTSEKEKVNKKNSKRYLLLAKYANIGYYLLTPLLIGVFLGLYLNKVVIGILLGFVATIYNLFHIIKE